jgi:hypothetical protein
MDNMLEHWKVISGGFSSALISGFGLFKFFSRFQTKAGCLTAHENHDQLMESRDETRAEEKAHFQTKLDDIHDDVKALGETQAAFIKKIDKDFYAPRTARTRRDDD